VCFDQLVIADHRISCSWVSRRQFHRQLGVRHGQHGRTAWWCRRTNAGLPVGRCRCRRSGRRARTTEHLARVGLTTVGALSDSPLPLLRRIIGVVGGRTSARAGPWARHAAVEPESWTRVDLPPEETFTSTTTTGICSSANCCDFPNDRGATPSRGVLRPYRVHQFRFRRFHHNHPFAARCRWRRTSPRRFTACLSLLDEQVPRVRFG